jgi:hypothetical protein
VRGQVAHLYIITGKIIVIFILIVTFLERGRDDKMVNWMAQSISTWFLPNFFVNATLLWRRSQVFELRHIFERFIGYKLNSDFVLYSDDETWIYILSFLCLYFYKSSLLVCNRASVFFMLCLSPSVLKSSAQTKSWCLPFNSSLSRFSWAFLMAFSNKSISHCW